VPPILRRPPSPRTPNPRRPSPRDEASATSTHQPLIRKPRITRLRTMIARIEIPNLDDFMSSKLEHEPTGLSILSHFDDLPTHDIERALTRPHRTSFYFLLFIIRGTIRFTVDFKELELRSGETLFVKPWQIRKSPSTKGAAEFYKLTFGPEVLARLHGRHRFWLDPYGYQKVISPPETASRLETTFSSLRDSVLHGRAVEVVWAYLNAVLAEIEAAYFANHGSSGQIGTLNDFMRFQVLVEERYAGHPRVDDLGRALGLGKTSLYELTKEWTGLSPKECLNHRLILEARRFLLFEGLPVKELASRLGFSDENYFPRFFRRHTGESGPSKLSATRGSRPQHGFAWTSRIRSPWTKPSRRLRRRIRRWTP